MNTTTQKIWIPTWWQIKEYLFGNIYWKQVFTHNLVKIRDLRIGLISYPVYCAYHGSPCDPNGYIEFCEQIYGQVNETNVTIIQKQEYVNTWKGSRDLELDTFHIITYTYAL